VIGGGDQIADVRREIGVGELAVAMAEAGKVEAQHRHPRLGQRAGNLRGRKNILGAGETMGK